MKGIRVQGISEKGTERVMSYTYPTDAKDDFAAVAEALKWANDEYTCEYDKETLEPIAGTTYKEFVAITGITLFEY